MHDQRPPVQKPTADAPVHTCAEDPLRASPEAAIAGVHEAWIDYRIGEHGFERRSLPALERVYDRANRAIRAFPGHEGVERKALDAYDHVRDLHGALPRAAAALVRDILTRDNLSHDHAESAFEAMRIVGGNADWTRTPDERIGNLRAVLAAARTHLEDGRPSYKAKDAIRATGARAGDLPEGYQRVVEATIGTDDVEPLLGGTIGGKLFTLGITLPQELFRQAVTGRHMVAQVVAAARADWDYMAHHTYARVLGDHFAKDPELLPEFVAEGGWELAVEGSFHATKNLNTMWRCTMYSFSASGPETRTSAQYALDQFAKKPELFQRVLEVQGPDALDTRNTKGINAYDHVRAGGDAAPLRALAAIGLPPSTDGLSDSAKDAVADGLQRHRAAKAARTRDFAEWLPIDRDSATVLADYVGTDDLLRTLG